MIRILLVDDQSLMRTGLRLVLDAQPDLEVVGEAADGAAAVTMVEALAPDVVLMDVRMPGTDGISATSSIVAGGHAARVLILTTFDLDEYVYAGLRAGASGFLLKDAPSEQLVAAVRSVARGDALIDPAITQRLIGRFIHAARPAPELPAELVSLTPRERDVLRQLAHGLSNAEIAARLVIEESTVKSHVAKILQKLGLRDRVQAVVLSYESGFVVPEPRD